jgi:NAD(P)-dependent dehydrogenase (short-subunit alcohol dehydrogenase family)
VSVEELAERAAEKPLGRIGEPEDLANVAAFPAAEKTASMIGQTAHPNRGHFPTA